MVRILIVDDASSVRLQLRTELEKAGHEVIEAKDGIEGIEQAEKHPSIDLIITDYNMPNLDGLSMLHRIRQVPGHERVRVFALTTEISRELKAQGKEAGVLVWVVKPFRGSVLLKTIDYCLSDEYIIEHAKLPASPEISQQETWNTFCVPHNHGHLAGKCRGTGFPIVFLHGGPGDDCGGLLPLAERLSANHRCILFDQRGSGDSSLSEYTPDTLSKSTFLEDINRILDWCGAHKAVLVGHSWGGIYGLLYATKHSERVAGLITLACGPVTSALNDVAATNIQSRLSQSEWENLGRWRHQRQQASKTSDAKLEHRAQAEIVRILTNVWIFQADRRSAFSTWYHQHHRYDRRVGAILWPQIIHDDLLRSFESITCPVTIVYGHQDYCPVAQAEILRQRIPHAKAVFFNECSHIPWIDQPEALHTFFAETLPSLY